MPVRDKKRIRNNRNPEKVFTGREDLLDIYLNDLRMVFKEQEDQLDETECHALNFCGTGGIGKTTLLDRLRLLTDEENKKRQSSGKTDAKIIHISLDMDSSGRINSFRRAFIMKVLKNSRGSGIKRYFPRTTFAFFQQEVDNPEEINEAPVIEPDSGVGRKVVSFIPTLLGLVIPQFQQIEKGVEIVEKITNTFGEKESTLNEVKKKCIKNACGNDEAVETIEEIAGESYNWINNNLADFFIEDLCDITKYEGPIVFFIDTCEYPRMQKLRKEKLTAEFDVFINDAINEVPYALWVLGGRVELCEENTLHSDLWKKVRLQDEPLRVFDESEISKYLELCGVDKELLEDGLFVSGIMKCSDGIPLLVQLLCDQYFMFLNEGESREKDISNYSVDPIALEAKYTNYLPAEESKLLFELASIGTNWNEELISSIAPKLDYFDNSKYEELLNCPEIKEIEDGVYGIAGTVHKVLLGLAPQGLKEKTRNAVYDYFVERVRTAGTGDDISKELEELSKYDVDRSSTAFINSVYDKLMRYIQTWRFDEVQKALDDFSEVFDSSNDNLFKYHYLKCKFWLFTKRGDTTEAVEISSDISKLVCQIIDDAHASSEIDSLLTDIRENQKTDFDISTIRNLIEIKLDSDFINAEAVFNSGNPVKALNLHNDCYSTRKILLGLNHPSSIDSLICIGRCKKEVGDVKEALDIHNKCLDVAVEWSGANVSDILQVKNDLLDEFIKTGEYGLALKECDKLLSELESEKRDKSSLYYYIQAKKLKCLQILENTDVYESYNECVKSLVKLVGYENKYTLETICNFVPILLKKQKSDEAIPMLLNCVKASERKYRDNWALNAKIQYYLSVCLIREGELVDALSRLEYCRSLTEKMDLRPTHPEICYILFEIAECKRMLGELETALDTYIKACEIESDYISDQNYLRTLCFLGGGTCCVEQKNWEDAVLYLKDGICRLFVNFMVGTRLELTVNCLINLGAAYYYLDKPDYFKSAKCHSEAYVISKYSLKNDELAKAALENYESSMKAFFENCKEDGLSQEHFSEIKKSIVKGVPSSFVCNEIAKMGGNYFNSYDYTNALPYLELCHTYFKTFMSEKSETVFIVEYTYLLSLVAVNDVEKATELMGSLISELEDYQITFREQIQFLAVFYLLVLLYFNPEGTDWYFDLKRIKDKVELYLDGCDLRVIHNLYIYYINVFSNALNDFKAYKYAKAYTELLRFEKFFSKLYDEDYVLCRIAREKETEISKYLIFI